MPGDVVANPGSCDPGDVVVQNGSKDAVVIDIDNNIAATSITSNTTSIKFTLNDNEDESEVIDYEIPRTSQLAVSIHSERDIPDIPCPSYEAACTDDEYKAYTVTQLPYFSHEARHEASCISNEVTYSGSKKKIHRDDQEPCSSSEASSSLNKTTYTGTKKNIYIDDQLPCSSHEATSSSYEVSCAEDEDRTYIDSELPCSSRSDATRRNSDDTSTADSDVCDIKTKKEIQKQNRKNIHLDDLASGSNRLGTTNLAYSSDSIDSLPVILDLNDNCRFRYSVVLDNYGNSNLNGLDFSEALAGPSTSSSSLEFNLRAVPLERTCSCNCHRRENSAPSYDELFSESTTNNKKMKTDSLKVKVDHDDEQCQGISCPMYRQKHHYSSKKHQQHLYNDNIVINYGNNSSNLGGSLRNSPNITPGNTPGRFRRILPAQMVKMLNSRGSSPVSDKAPPNYRSLIFSILQDEPPKYEEVTGKKLADELVRNIFCFLNSVQIILYCHYIYLWVLGYCLKCRNKGSCYSGP